jgi:protein-S-isoprenylcysteine O-methyltransferase Ste14
MGLRSPYESAATSEAREVQSASAVVPAQWCADVKSRSHYRWRTHMLGFGAVSPTACLSGLWLAWLLGWFLGARSTARTVARQSTASRLAHSVFIVGGATLLFLHAGRLGSLLQPLLPRWSWVAWVGVVVVALGLGFTGWARVQLGRFWSGAVTLKADHTLIRTGPYALTRHPIYTGLLLALTGTALVRGTLAGLAGLTLAAAGIMLKIRQEERFLLAHFGDTYRAYQRDVPMVVPWMPLREEPDANQ